jgi:hypothetical protein
MKYHLVFQFLRLNSREYALFLIVLVLDPCPNIASMISRLSVVLQTKTTFMVIDIQELCTMTITMKYTPETSTVWEHNLQVAPVYYSNITANML